MAIVCSKVDQQHVVQCGEISGARVDTKHPILRLNKKIERADGSQKNKKTNDYTTSIGYS